MKLVFSLISVFVILCVGGVLIAPAMIDWNQHKGKVLEQIKTHAGYDVEINGDISFAVVPSPHVSLKNVIVKAPQPVTEGVLADIGEASVYVALTPLFKKQIHVKGVKIEQPNITLEVASDGAKSWESAKLKAVKDVKDTASLLGGEQKNAKPAPANDVLQNIAVDNVSIKGAKFTYRDQQKKSETVIDDLNASVSADTLYGPYEGDVSFALNGKVFDVSLQAESYDTGTKILPMKVAVTLDGEIETRLSGVLDMSAGIAVQGPLSAEIKNLHALTGNKALPKSLSVKGMLKADNTAVELSQLEGRLGSDPFKGRVSVKLNPLVASVDIAADEGLNVLSTMPRLKQAAVKSLVASKDGTVLFKDTVLKLNGQSVALDGSFKGGKNGARAALDAIVTAQNLNLDDILRVVSKPQGDNGAAPSDAPNEVGESQLAAKSKSSLKKTIQNIAIPLDVNAKADIKDLVYQGAKISGLKADIAARQNAVTINSFSAANYAGAAISAKGRISDLAGVSGISGSAAFKTSDVKAFMTALGKDAKGVPKPVKAVDLAANFEGDADALTFTTNIGAAGAKIIAKGDAMNAFETPTFSNLALQVKHSNLNRLIGDFAPGMSYASLAKPLDFYAVIDSQGKTHSLKNMKVDLAGTPVTGDLTFDLAGAKPKISGALNAGDIVIAAEKAQAEAAARTAKGKAVQSSAAVSKSAPKWSTKAINFDWMNAFGLDLKLAAKSLVFETWAFEKPSLGIAVANRTLTIRDLKAGLYGGQAAVNASVDASSGGAAKIALDAALSGVQIEELMTSLAAGQKLIKGAGSVSLKSSVTTSGRSQAEFVNGLNGQGTTTGQNIILDGFDLSRFARAMDVNAKPGDTLTGLWKGSTKGGSTAFESLDGNFTIENGIVKIAKMDLTGVKADMATTGTVDIPKWWVSTKHAVSVKDTEGVPPFEFSFDGSLADPKQTFAQGPLQDYLSRKISRKLEKELSDKLGSKIKDKLGDGELGNLLGGFLGAGQQGQQQQAPANDNTPPAQQQQGEQAPAEQQPQQQQDIQPDELINDVLKGLF